MTTKQGVLKSMLNQSITYLQALQAMELLLRKVNEILWADIIESDIKLWQTSQRTDRHLSIYGGMGSFNDLMLCQQNGHSMTTEQSPWLQVLFGHLQNLCNALAKHHEHTALIKELIHVPIILKIHGERCLDCGYSQIASQNIEYYIAEQLIPPLLLKTNLDLTQFVEQIFNLQIDALEEHRHKITTTLTQSKIHIHGTSDWMRPCPHCNSNNTAAYRWQLASSKNYFEPSSDNLPLNQKK